MYCAGNSKSYQVICCVAMYEGGVGSLVVSPPSWLSLLAIQVIEDEGENEKGKEGGGRKRGREERIGGKREMRGGRRELFIVAGCTSNRKCGLRKEGKGGGRRGEKRKEERGEEENSNVDT